MRLNGHARISAVLLRCSAPRTHFCRQQWSYCSNANCCDSIRPQQIPCAVMADTTAVDYAVKLLPEFGLTAALDENRPDVIERNAPAVDFSASSNMGVLAIEHSLHEPYVGYSADMNTMAARLDPARRTIEHVIPPNASITIDMKHATVNRLRRASLPRVHRMGAHHRADAAGPAAAPLRGLAPRRRHRDHDLPSTAIRRPSAVIAEHRMRPERRETDDRADDSRSEGKAAQARSVPDGSRRRDQGSCSSRTTSR